jgi:uncharacterized protein (DUF1684 family)
MSELEEFRAEKDAFFRDDPRSPLTPGQRNGFGGLAYFPEEPGLSIHAKLETQGVDRDEAIEMQTTTAGSRSTGARASSDSRSRRSRLW